MFEILERFPLLIGRGVCEVKVQNMMQVTKNKIKIHILNIQIVRSPRRRYQSDVTNVCNLYVGTVTFTQIITQQK
jgi:hypothetical protein